MSARLTLLAAVAAVGLMGAANAETIAITHAKIVTLARCRAPVDARSLRAKLAIHS